MAKKKLLVMSKKLLVIKLGGSVITIKDAPAAKANLKVIKRLAKEIKAVLDQDKYKIILVHGVGSFAHGLVKKYNLHQGIKTDRQIVASDQVKRQISRLNSIIVKHLLGAKIRAVGLIPHTFIVQSKGRLKNIDMEIINAYLNNNQIPVLFGDLVLDDKWGCSVLSGDTIVCHLAKILKAWRVIFLSDVDGIFDSDPKKNPEAKLISEVNNSNIKQVLKGLSPSGRDDVSGEMIGKISEIQKYLKRVPVLITNGLKADNLVQAVKAPTKAQVGTRILLYSFIVYNQKIAQAK
ncbi:MAG: isopentenyl phosphate kinase [Patescibacteria group bacterium]